MSQTRKPYTREFKRDLGLSRGSLARWESQLTRKGKAAFPGHGWLSEAEARLRQLELENAILRQAGATS